MAQKNIEFMLHMVKSFLDGNVDRTEFELDFNTELLSRYRKMVKEDHEFAELIYDYLSEDGVDCSYSLSDSDFKTLIQDQYDEVMDIAEGGFC